MFRFRPTESKSSRGEWRIWDHGDPEVDEHWRRMLSRGRFPSLGADIPPGDGALVPPELAAHGTFPESFYICEAILAATP